MAPTWVSILATILGGAVMLGFTAIVGGFLHYRRERLLTHAERMKALELGRDLPDDSATARYKAIFGGDSQEAEGGETESLPHNKCFGTALWVAFWGFVFASQTGTWGNAGSGIAIAIAGSAGAIGVTGVICGTILAMRKPSLRPPTVMAKEAVESDAYDVVGRRG